MARNEKRYVLGKCDYNETGRANCEAAITWTLQDGRFSMQGEIWMPCKRDIEAGGQCVDTVAAFFPDDAKARRMVAIWREWHLNDMQAGSPAQRAFLEANPVTDRLDHYGKACAVLKEAGLNPDPGYSHNGKPYAYGSAWLKRDIPADIIAEIEAWG